MTDTAATSSAPAGRAAATAPGAPAPRRRAEARSPRRPRTNLVLQALMVLMVVYTLLPLYWLTVNATKSNGELFRSNGLWLGSEISLWDNIVATVTYQDGIYLTWLFNTALYSVAGAVGATVICAWGGYALAKFEFPTKRLVRAIVFGAITIPATALAVPTFLLFAELGITNTRLAIIIPALVSPFGLYLMTVFAADSVPDSLLDAAKIDGANAWTTFWRVSFRLMAPGFATVLLFNLVHTWNNYFLPLIMLNDPSLYPLTVGLNQLNSQVTTGANLQPVYNVVLTGSLLAIVPLIASFLFLQRYWQSGLAAGSVKQ
ncbi:carbohydrate ABC transporter permease [Streptomonospora sp. PA3]|uniref:carbohydrate ABC transporter permease n=1 Tax=Streptomonospora sp. PA3 TaxID=2607326 RepID=UPI0012DF396A|nr:carbohydrate ABC transporter permease [Streptomonospora sp. PA3]MUL41203.1 carbohydrate ABC transporter permease [Streptomonospora sp. PA3]